MVDTADVNAVAVEGKRADAGRVHRDREKIIQRYASIVQEGGADRLAMAEDQNRAISGIVAKLLEVLHDALLQAAHAFAVWRTTGPAPAVPTVPSCILGKIGERASCPIADIDFVEGSGDFNREAKMLREDRG